MGSNRPSRVVRGTGPSGGRRTGARPPCAPQQADPHPAGRRMGARRLAGHPRRRGGSVGAAYLLLLIEAYRCTTIEPAADRARELLARRFQITVLLAALGF